MFFETKQISSKNVAISTVERCYSYGELTTAVASEIAATSQILRSDFRRLSFLLVDNSYASVVRYLASLVSGEVSLLLDANIKDGLLRQLLAHYSPNAIWSTRELALEDYEAVSLSVGNTYLARQDVEHDLHPDLALLLSTSGSTGSPQLVRLSRKNLQRNAEAIAQYLDITSEERPITSLPLSYSYGLSVVNSHLLCGASLVVTNDSLVSRGFWDLFKQHNVTSLSGVPFTYRLLKKLKLEAMNLPSLRTLTQAGGALDDELRDYCRQLARQLNVRFFAMYGQTEATARISYLPPELFQDKSDSIGLAIPGGSLGVEPDGELVYRGENVMLGYAECCKDLALGDELLSVLPTGDLGRVDSEGYFYVEGRKKRFIKLNGLRVNLDELERGLSSVLSLEVACCGRDECLFISVVGESDVTRVSGILRELFGMNSHNTKISFIDKIPMTGSGKRDYRQLMAKVSDD